MTNRGVLLETYSGARNRQFRPDCQRCGGQLAYDGEAWACLNCAHLPGNAQRDNRDPYRQFIDANHTLIAWLEQRIAVLSPLAKGGRVKDPDRKDLQRRASAALKRRRSQLRRAKAALYQLTRKATNPAGLPGGPRCSYCGFHPRRKEHRACIARRAQEATQ
jgi:hypothetical protein